MDRRTIIRTGGGLLLALALALSIRLGQRAGAPLGTPPVATTRKPTTDIGPETRVRRASEPPRRGAAPREGEWETHEEWTRRCADWAAGLLPEVDDVVAFRDQLDRPPADVLGWISSQQPGRRRQDLLAAFCAEWGARDFSAAWAWATARQDDREALAVIAGMASRGELDPQVVEWCYARPALRTMRVALAMRVLESGAEPGLFALGAARLRPFERASWIPIAMKSWAGDDPLAALAGAALLENPADRNMAALAVVGAWPEERFDSLREAIPALDGEEVVSLAKARIEAPLVPMAAPESGEESPASRPSTSDGTGSR